MSNPAPAVRRDLRSPYFVFRTPDGLGTYFTGEHLPVVKSPKEPLARFLVNARITETGTLRSLQYDFEGITLDTACPMEFLPQSEIDAFAAAVRDFYDKAHEATPRIVPHEKRLRAHFRLPDPDLEPDAYWVYGPAHDRKLLVLWGCEFKAGSSLPLAPDPALKIPAGRTILDKLQARVMSWEARQREALKLAWQPGEPISRFLARPAVDTSGQSAGYHLRGQTLPAKNFKPLRRILTGEIAAFEAAARKFYDKAAPEAAGVTAYEKELRRALRLSDPDQRPGAYLLQGKSLVIVVDSKETHAATLPMIDHPALPVTAPVAPPSGAEATVVVTGVGSPGGSVAAKLRARAVSSGLVYMIAAAAVVILAVAGVLFWRFYPDRTPPTVVKYDQKTSRDVGLPSDTRVIVRFSEPIAAASIKTGAADASFRFGDDKARLDGAPTFDKNEQNTIILKTSKLLDGEKYELAIRNLTDLAGNKLPATAPLSFEFFDTIAPRVAKISGGPNKNQLTLVFSKPLRPESVTATGNYQVATPDGSAIRLRSAGFDSNDKTATFVILEADRDFSNGLPYRLAGVAGVRDTARQGNYVDFPAKGLDFDYKDIMPPRILEAVGTAGRLEVTVTFSKPLGKEKEGRAAGEDVTHYTVTTPDGATLVLAPGSAHFNEAGNTLRLRFDEPEKFPRGRYQIAAKGIHDVQGNTIEEAAVPFEFFDMDDHSPLTVTAADKSGKNPLRLEFNRVLRRADANDRTKFELLDDQRRPLRGISVRQVQRVPDNPTQVLLTLSEDPPAGTQLLVAVAGVTDIFGHREDQTVRLGRPVSYSGATMSEQVLAWQNRPTAKGNRVTLVIKEQLTKDSAQDPANYEFTPATVQIERIDKVSYATDKGGARRTVVELVLRAPLLSPAGVKVAAHDLRIVDLDFLGAQNLDPIELTPAP